MNVILTSDPHLGKTTVLAKVAESLRKEHTLGGILCPGDSVMNFDGEDMYFCVWKEQPDSVKVGKCYILKNALEFAKKEIVKDRDLNFIDEYGPLEWTKKGLYEAVNEALPKGNCIIIVRKHMLKLFLERYKDIEFKVFELSLDNRDTIDKDIIKFITH